MSEGKQAENRAGWTIEGLYLAVDRIPVMMWRTGPDRGATWFNRQWLDFVDRRIEQDLGNGWTENLHPDDREPTLATYIAAFDSRQPMRLETRVLRHDGEYRWILASGSPLYGPDGAFTGYIGTCIDISERKRAETALKESEARKAAILETALDAIVSMDQEGRIIEFNPAAENMFGFRRAEVVGQGLAELIIPPAKREAHRRGLANFLATGSGPVLNRRIEVTALRRDGTEFPVELAITPRDAGGSWEFSAYLRDLSDRYQAEAERRSAEESLRRAEAQLRLSQRIEAVGRLAGGIAHDFNNFLTLISASTDLLLGSNRLDETSRRLIDDVRKAGERAADLTRQLLAFSRKQILQPATLHLGELVADTVRMLERLIEEDVVLTTSVAADLRPMRADPSQIEQVILNLALNARDAMPQGGRLTIEARNVEIDETLVVARPEIRPGHYVMLALTDTGTGMDQKTQERIFEPFFSTKEAGQGTGLGLATAYGIVKQSGGFIYVYSEVGHGTTFKLYFPALPPSAQIAPSRAAAASAQGGNETVLFVEDDDSLRPLISAALRDLGYSVLEAADGDEALRQLARHGDAVRLLVTDVVMPGMSGRDLSERAQAAVPTVRILYLSGYTDDAVVRHGVLEGEAAFLQKPFTPGVLGQKVRELLDR